MTTKRKTKVALVSLGCPKNLVDSEKMLGLLAGREIVVGAPMEDADVIVVNTCGFLGAAREESLGVIREALAHKAAGRARRVVVAGCLVNRDGDRIFQDAPGIDAIVGVNDREKIVDAVMGEKTGEKTPRNRTRWEGEDTERFRLTPKHTAYLRISEGCSRECSFCTIPAIRGPFRSKPPQTVMKEARELIADGAVELNVIGQDTTGYGADLGGGATLAKLLRKLDGLDGVEWIRLLYAYPWGFTQELLEAMAGCRHVVPYVDVPLQHVSTSVLRRMRRGTTRRSIEGLMRNLRAIEGMVIRTTLIVGFPGETEEEFRELLAFVKEAKFDALGVFEYSPEEGTPAAEMRGQKPSPVKARRARQVMLAQQKIAFAANAAVTGSPVTVLVDGLDAAGRCIGRYYGQAPDIDSVCLLDRPRPAGEFVEGTVTGWDGYDLKVSVGRRNGV
ncbi:MAG: 30S ribosomal protein S12 methylthiotransferase RimO [Planctomycetota bacterium]|nr:30S ribosomal protein S12 methylthiotransferase RimO [Planctomycetota bacterium]